MLRETCRRVGRTLRNVVVGWALLLGMVAFAVAESARKWAVGP